MREEQESSKSITPETPATPVEHVQWQTGRLLLALLMCGLLIAAAIVFERYG